MEQTVTMEASEWQSVLAVMCNAQGPGITWATTNPLIMKLGAQLQAQTAEVGPARLMQPNGADDDSSDPMNRTMPRGRARPS